MAYDLKAPPASRLEVPPTYDQYEAHPFANMFPMIQGDEFEQLKRDIAKNGILQPIVLHEGKILDGRNRYKAARECGHKFTPANFKHFDGADAKAFAISTNIHRRHLTQAQKQEFVKRLIAENPNASNRQIARLAGVNHRTVAAAKKSLRPQAEVDYEEFTGMWNSLTDEQQTAFVKEYKIDIQEMLA